MSLDNHAHSLHNRNTQMATQFLADVLTFSPSKYTHDSELPDCHDDLPVLRLEKFNTAPKVEFGSVEVGDSKVCLLRVENITSEPQLLELDKPRSSALGFSLEDDRFEIRPACNVYLNVHWTAPAEYEVGMEGKVFREVYLFKWNGKHRLSVTVQGTAVLSQVDKKKLAKAMKPVVNAKSALLPKKSSVDQENRLSVHPAATSKKQFTVSTARAPLVAKNSKSSQIEGSSMNCSALHVDASFFGGIGSELDKSCLAFEPDAWDSATPRVYNTSTRTPWISTSLSQPTSPAKKALKTPRQAMTDDVIKATSTKHTTKTFAFQPSNTVFENADAELEEAVMTFDMRHIEPVQSTVAHQPSSSKSMSTSTLSKSAVVGAAKPESRQMFFDERWAEKQERLFSRWLNFMLDPASQADSNAVAAPILSLSERMQDAACRRDAQRVYRAAESAQVVARLEQEVELGRISLRTDISEKHFHADIGMRNETIKLYFMSLNPAWLRLAMETVLNQPMPYAEAAAFNLTNDNATMRSMLQKWLLARVWSNADLEHEYSTNLGLANSFRDGYWAALGKYSLKRCLQIWWCIELLKREHILPSDPRLFACDAPFKATSDMLQDFAKRHLRGEANLARHLSHLGATMTHKQSPLEELSLGVKNLAVELRDGVRLTKVAELLSSAPSGQLMKQLRLPSDSRLRKVHNVGVALNALKAEGISLSACSVDDVIDGHRERTLELLWRVMLHWQSKQADAEENAVTGVCGDATIAMLAREVRTLQRNASVQERHQCHRFHLVPLFPNGQTLQASGELVPSVAVKGPSLSATFGACGSGALDTARIQWLGRWVASVCSRFENQETAPVANWSKAFADGRVLCQLLHFYAPHILRLDEIGNQTSLQLLPKEGDAELGGYLQSNIKVDERAMARALEVDKSNIRMFMQRAYRLGSLPPLLHESDLYNAVPDERVIITFVSFLARRLISLNREQQAVCCIQAHWRRHCQRRDLVKMATEQVQAYAVASLNRTALQHSRAALMGIQRRLSLNAKVQRAVANYSEAKRNAQALAARRNFAALSLQSVWRGRVARKQVVERRQQLSALHHFAFVCHQRAQFVRAQQLVVKMQARVRGWLLRRGLAYWNFSANRIQATFRGFAVRKQTASMKAALIQTQAYSAVVLSRHHFDIARQAVCQVQARACTVSQSSAFATARRAAVIVQSSVRRWIAQRQLINLRFARFVQHIVLAQSLVRRFMAIRQLRGLKQAELARQEAARRQRSALMLQTHWRRACAQRELSALRVARQRNEAAICLQANYRRLMAQQQLLQLRIQHQRQCAALALQSNFRRLKAQQELKQLRIAHQRQCAAVMLQTHFRRLRAQKELHVLRVAFQRQQASIKMQSHWRRLQAQRQLCVLHVQRQRQNAAITLQSNWRRLQAQKTLRLMKADYAAYVAEQLRLQRLRAAMVLQSHFRSLRAQKELIRLRAEHRARVEKAAVEMISRWRVMCLARRAFLAFRRANKAFDCISSMFKSNLSTSLRTAASIVASSNSTCQMNKMIAQRLMAKVSKMHQQQSAAVTLQRSVRGWLARRRVFTLRATIEQVKAMAMVNVARLNMAEWRALRAREAEFGMALRFLQLRFRFSRHWRAVTKATAMAQASYAAQKAHSLMIRKRSAALVIQSWVRGHAVRCRLAAALKSSVQAIAEPVEPKARAVVAPCLQAGAKPKPKVAAPVTKAVAAPVKQVRSEEEVFARRLQTLRARWRSGRQWQLAAPEARLGHQTAAAIDTLLHSKQLSSMFTAAKRLEATTRLSLAACAEAVDAGMVPVLLRLMSDANRSAPYIELVRCCQRVLVHLVDNGSTVVNSSAVGTAVEAAAYLTNAMAAAELFVEQLSVHRERDDMCAAAARLLLMGVTRHAVFAKALASSADLMRRFRGATALMEKRSTSTVSATAVADLKRAMITLDAV